MAEETTTTNDYIWKSEAPPRSYRPQQVALIPAPFDPITHHRATYIPYDPRHYEAAFSDLYQMQQQPATSRSKAGGCVAGRCEAPASALRVPLSAEEAGWQKLMHPDYPVAVRSE